MAQGTRKGLASLAAGLLLTGIVGCMDSDSKPLKAPPKAQGATAFPGGTVKPNQSTNFGTTGMGGVTQTGAQQMAPRNPPAGGFASPGSTMGGTGTIGGQTVPGSYGNGTPMTPSGGAYQPPPISPNPSFMQKGDSGYQGNTTPPSSPPGLGHNVQMPPGTGTTGTTTGGPVPPNPPTGSYSGNPYGN